MRFAVSNLTMNAIKHISKNEHKLLLIVAFASIIFVLSVITFDIIKAFTSYTSKSQFSGQTANTFPLFHFLTVLILVALVKTKRFLLPFISTVLYAFAFIYGLSARYKGGRLGGEEFSPKVDFHEQIFRAANEFDYIAAFFISILLFWQISILLRMLIKNSQRKNVLP